MTSARRRAALAGWILASSAMLVALVLVGPDRPGYPPSRAEDWRTWAAAHDTLDVVAAVVRVLAIGLVGYLLAVTVLQLVATISRRPTLRGLCARAGPTFLATLTTAVVTTTGPAAATAGDDAEIAPGSGATMELVDPDVRTQLPWAEPPPAPTPQPPPGPQQSSVPAATEWLVRPGDHLWSIAEQVLVERTGADPDERATHRYWRQLIDANRDRLVDPENPDLIVPGQRFMLPPQR